MWVFFLIYFCFEVPIAATQLVCCVKVTTSLWGRFDFHSTNRLNCHHDFFCCDVNWRTIRASCFELSLYTSCDFFPKTRNQIGIWPHVTMRIKGSCPKDTSNNEVVWILERETLNSWGLNRKRFSLTQRSWTWNLRYLVDPASSHMLVLKIKPCMSKCKWLHSETANGSLNQL